MRDRKKQFLQSRNQFNANGFGNRLSFVMNGLSFPVILSDSACDLFDSNIIYVTHSEIRDYIRKYPFMETQNMGQYHQN